MNANEAIEANKTLCKVTWKNIVPHKFTTIFLFYFQNIQNSIMEVEREDLVEGEEEKAEFLLGGPVEANL